MIIPNIWENKKWFKPPTRPVYANRVWANWSHQTRLPNLEANAKGVGVPNMGTVSGFMNTKR